MPFRTDKATRDPLMSGPRPAPLMPYGEPPTLPEPVFPQYPEKLGDVDPHVRPSAAPGEPQPSIAYLFTEWKCNLECHSCRAFQNQVKCITEDTARRSIDWLHETGCRALALMGGEVLLRPQFVHKVVYYAAKQGFWVYVTTNGRLLRKDVIDRLGDAGVATVNLAVGAAGDCKELRKALAPVRPTFAYLLKKQYVYGFAVLFNVNIARVELRDVRQLAEMAHNAGLAAGYHLDESAVLEPGRFQHLENVIDWLIEKNRSGYKMLNSVRQLEEMKTFLKGTLQDPICRAGQNSLLIRPDGTLAPCFPMYSATRDWGVAGEPRFEPGRLAEIKRYCQPHCFSTLNPAPCRVRHLPSAGADRFGTMRAL